ncbi:hypothetical protein GCM10023093_09170 [Nemorincola caseinilytica]|uniref:DUF4397 domain-containing protein n=1 Tax=Nemorincola caseinilytica TaxID=2054315 RepID=A0ABP8N734_9BACT
MKRILLSSLVLSLLVSLHACKKKDNTTNTSTSVMFVNGCAGTLPGIDAKADDRNVSGALNLTFPSNSGYRLIGAGTSVKLDYYLTNVGTPVASKTVTIETGKHYSAFAGGIVTSPTFVFTTDDLTAPGSNGAKIRFVNLSPDGLNVTANAGNNVIDSAVTTMEVSPFREVIAGVYDLKAGDPSNLSTVVSLNTRTLAAGKIYTLMLTGTTSGTGVSALQLTLISNN